MPIDESLEAAAEAEVRESKQELGRRQRSSGRGEKSEPDDEEMVTIVVSTSEIGERRPVKIPDRRNGGWLCFNRNEPVQISRRFLRQLGEDGPFIVKRSDTEKDITGDKKVIRKIWRFPYHIVD